MVMQWSPQPQFESGKRVGQLLAYVCSFDFFFGEYRRLFNGITYSNMLPCVRSWTATKYNETHVLCQIVRLEWKIGIEQIVTRFWSVVINTAVRLRQATATVSVENRVTEGNTIVSGNSNTSTTEVLRQRNCQPLTNTVTDTKGQITINILRKFNIVTITFKFQDFPRLFRFWHKTRDAFEGLLKLFQTFMREITNKNAE